MKHPSSQSGYTLLFAVLIAALVLSVAVFILGVSKKQFALAVAARESTFAIYNADSAMECLAYAYYNGNLATSSPTSVYCNSTTSITTSWANPPTYDTGVTTLFASSPYITQSGPIIIPFSNGGCAKVTVTDGYDTSNNHQTIIDSRGYNLGDGTACPKISSQTVERALRLTYH